MRSNCSRTFIASPLTISAKFTTILCCSERLMRTAPELRELESKLKAAYAQKEVAIQIQEKEAARLEKKVRNYIYSSFEISGLSDYL